MLPQTTARFNNLLERLTELRKAIKPRGLVYYSERTQTKVSKREEAQRAESGRGQAYIPSCSLPAESYRQPLLSA